MPRGGRRLPAGCARILRAANVVLHTGDVTTAAVLAELAQLAGVEEVPTVLGNMDGRDLRESLPRRRVIEAEGLRIGLVHDPGPCDGRRARLAAWFPDCDVIAYGHTHVPEVVRHGDAWMVNPGSPTERRRAPSHTLAVVRDGVPELVQLD